jgi:hypothetical protein
MKKYFAFGILFALCCAVEAQENTLNGKWAFHLEVSGHDTDAVCTLGQDGKILKGKCEVLGTLTGEIDGLNVVLKTTGTQGSADYKGTLTDGKMAGTLTVADYGMDGRFQATLVK